MSDTKLWPLDFAALRKGMWLTTEELEAATSLTRDHDAFRMRVLKLRTLIEDRTMIVSRIDGAEPVMRLRLMTDAETLAWNIEQADRHEAGLARSARRTAMINPAALSESEQRVHDHNSRKIQAMALAARAERLKHDRIERLRTSPAVASLPVPEPDKGG